MFCVLDTVEDESVTVFENRVEMNSVSDYCDILIWIIKPSNIHALSTQLSADKIHTSRHEFDGGHSLLYRATCWVLWLAGHLEI
jgi:hypothetical protein